MPESSSDNSSHPKPNYYDENDRINFDGMTSDQAGAAYAIDAERVAHNRDEQAKAKARFTSDRKKAQRFVAASKIRVKREEDKGDKKDEDWYEKLKKEVRDREELLKDIIAKGATAKEFDWESWAHLVPEVLESSRS
ncbi:hypothetical protein CTAM01_03204 [Colletotrichum tamarilloi]|uniref:BZIP domain-containing protein n=1 Tax=Colletotrichum tamarilloi TaxID=1209934 RepID=A0ABQ9RM45_9PEZI|nr:uncharacterized protein CTAM01_03204 [Colletotrichum tamarilloi]KAK1506872.1 hypothetical protein CTAM01_03204 [Colletotrichum tamarilloi]